MTSTFHFLPVRFRAYLRHPRVRAAWLSFFWGVVLFYFLFCALILATRWILLPQVDKYKDDIARFIGKTLQAEVSIGRVSPRWDTFWPHLSLRDVVIERSDPRTNNAHILHLPQVEASFYWRSVLGEPLFKTLDVTGAEITVRRVADEVFDIAGFVFDFNSQPRNASGGNATDWLLRQGSINLTSGKISYVDLTAKPQPRTTTLENINFTFENAVNDYRVGFQGELDARHDNTIDIRARFTAPLFGDRSWKTWSGELFASADNLDVARLTRPVLAARELLKSGRGSTRTWLKFENARPLELTSYLGLSDVILTFAKHTEPLHVKTLSTRLSETFSDGAIHAKAENLDFELIDGTASSDLQLETTILLDPESGNESQRSSFRLADLNVRTLQKLLPSVPFPKAAAQLIREHEAAGEIRNFEVSWSGTPAQTEHWRIRTDFEGLSIAHTADGSSRSFVSGFENLTGSAEFADKSGHIRFETRSGAVSLPGLFENPRVELDTLTGGLSWRLTPTPATGAEALTVNFDNITIANDDALASVSGHWRQTDTPAGYIDLTGNLVRARADRVWRYMPLVVSESVRDWLEGGLVSGQAKNGRFELKGDLVKYPWIDVDKDQGHFLVTAEIDSGAIDYVPSMKRLEDGSFERAASWPLLTDIKGSITFEGASMTVIADRAVTGGATVTSARADIPDLGAHENTKLLVIGKAQGALQDFFNYVEASPVTGYLSGAFTGTKAKGPGTLDLSLDIPLLHAADTKVKGAVTMQEASIDMGWPKPPLKDVEGTVHFTEKGAAASNVHARAFGAGDASISVYTGEQGEIMINAAGSLNAADLAWFARNPYFDPIAERFSGMLPFVTSIMIKKNHGVSVSARSSLQGVAIDLPVPLKKAAQDVWNTTFSFTPATIRNNSGYLIKVGSDKRFDVLLHLPAGDAKQIVRGDIAVGERARLPKQGISVSVNSPKLKVLDWQPLVQTLLAIARDNAPTSKTGAAGEQAGLSQIEVKADELLLEDGTVHKSRCLVAFDAADNVDVTLDSNEIVGRLRYEAEGRGSVTGSFERLHLSATATQTLKRFLQGESVDVVIQPRPTVLPSLDLVAEEFFYDDKKIGRLVLQAEASGSADEETLRITNFAVFSDDSALTGTGAWTQGKKLSGQYPGQTNFNLTFTTKNLGRKLDELGNAGVIENATGTARGHFSFQGIPWAPKLDTLAGAYNFDFRKGTFAKVDTGTGGLVLSFLSLQSLFKRLTLDFSDFKSGFSFDSFTGSAEITNGVLSSDNTKIVGTHGTILLSGKFNVVEGTLDSRVIVLPEINAANASLALAFVNPAVGIGSFLAQLLLRTPLSHLFKVEYSITGTWDNPIVTKISSDNEQKTRKER